MGCQGFRGGSGMVGRQVVVGIGWNIFAGLVTGFRSCLVFRASCFVKPYVVEPVALMPGPGPWLRLAFLEAG